MLSSPLTLTDGLPSVWVLVVAAWVLTYAAVIFYRLTFHPLAKFPGPRLAAATYWYEAYYDLAHKGGSLFAPKIRELHAKYGPIIRINPSEISVNDAEFHDKLYAPQPAVRDRHPNFSSALGTSKGSFSSVDHFLHRSRREAYNPFFATSNVLANEEMVRDKVNHLCELLVADKGNERNLQTYLAAIAYDSFYTWAFGSQLQLLDNVPKAKEINDTINLFVTSSPFYRMFPTTMKLAKMIPRPILRRLSNDIGRVFDVHDMILEAGERYVAKEQEQSTSEKVSEEPTSSVSEAQYESLFSIIRHSQAPDSEKSASRISQEGTEMFMATFTPGRAMMMAMYYLHANPEVLKALRKELDEVNPDPKGQLTYKMLNSLPYLRAIMKEIYRISFPAGARLPMTCHEVMEFGDWKIPPNFSISVNHRNLLLDPEVFPEPLAFSPERWLDKAHPIDEKRYFVAFGKGARACPGREFVTQMSQLTICTLIQRYRFELKDTLWERDVFPSRESTMIAPAFASKGIQLELLGAR